MYEYVHSVYTSSSILRAYSIYVLLFASRRDAFSVWYVLNNHMLAAIFPTL